MKLDNTMKAVVTGGASGMGKAVCDMLASQGLKVIILDKNIDDARKVSEFLKGHAIETDVSSAKSVESAFSEIKEIEGKLRVCVNCAGIAPAKRVVGREGPMALEAFQTVININLVGTFNVLRMAASHMFELDVHGEERGVIINTASVAAYEGQIGQAAYSASKGGVVGMTLPIAREFAKQGIRVNTIAPGLIATPLLLNMPQEVQDSLAASVPFPKRLGKPEEFAGLAQHIIDNPLINGEVIRLDGAIRMAPK